MIQRIFIAIAILLVVSVLGTVIYISKPAEIPLPPVEPVTQQAQLAVPSSTSQVSYGSVIQRVGVALQRYAEGHGHPFVLDKGQQDGGVQSRLLAPYADNLPVNDSSVFWRLVQGDGGLVLCAQILNQAEFLEVSTAVSNAVRELGLSVDVTSCGDSAIGAHLQQVVRPEVPAESLPELPPKLPPGVPGTPAGVPALVRPVAEPVACEETSAIDERLSRLL